MYFRPNTLSEAVDFLASSGGTILAGGTDVFPALGDAPLTGTVVDISALCELRRISSDEHYFHIGALTTWTDLVRSPLPRCFDCLKSAAREIGGTQIQNRGTIAGNLCNASPAADSVPPLLALDAEVELTSHTGTRRMKLTDFIVGNRKTLRQPGELLAQVLVPRTAEAASSTFLKLGARRYLVISIAMVAVVLQRDREQKDREGLVVDARVSVGSCSAVARRLPQLERALLGAPMSDGLGSLATATHLQHISPITDVRATAMYRQDAALQLVQRALDTCARQT